MEGQWRNEPDYSHGYLIVPLALLLLYRRQDLYPGAARSVSWAGFSLLLAAIVLRVAGRLAYMDFLDGWTLVLWVAGIVWIFGGWAMLRWALPAVLFLVLLVPLPYQAESLLSWRLQGLSTSLSVGVLQSLGLPAIAEGHTIWLDDQRMMVEEACSGLRIFVGMAAMAYLFAVLARRAWIDKWVIIAAALPIAILVNVVRVTATVMAFHWLSNKNAHIAHDLLGILMILLGAFLLAATKFYWEMLYRPFEITLELKSLASLPSTAAAVSDH
jgi:exosortase